MEPTWDLIIIGGGPSGINCAIEAGRAGLSALILEKGVAVNSLFHFPVNMTFFSTSRFLEIGGIPFISHSDKPTRQEALEYYRRLIQHFNLTYHPYEEVLSMEHLAVSGHFQITSSRSNYRCRKVVIATGFYDRPVLLHVQGEHLPKVKHYYDDPHRYVRQKVVIVGAANSACDAALEIWQKGGEVTMVIRGGEISPRVKYWIRPNIENRIREGSIVALFHSEVAEIREGSVLVRSGEREIQELVNDWVLALTGYQPDFAFLRKLGVDFEDGLGCRPAFDEKTLETHLPGVYIAGVICGGAETSRLFIENTRDHALRIVTHILAEN